MVMVIVKATPVLSERISVFTSVAGLFVGKGPSVSESVVEQDVEADVTVNVPEDVAVTPPTVTVITPDVAPLGTVTTSCVAVADTTVATTPPIVTVLEAAVVLKFVPVITIVEPSEPLLVKLVMVGEPVDVVVVTVKSLEDVPVCPFTVTAILPVLTPEGTVTVSCVVVAAVTVAVAPLKVTVLFVVTALKFSPVMVTVSPATPLVGVKLVTDGTGVVSSSLLHETISGAIRPLIPRLFKNCFLSMGIYSL
jgi:hypothetical protein